MDDNKIRVIHDGNGKIVYLFNGKNLFGGDGRLSWESADFIALLSTRAARQAEEYCKANRIIMDNALLQRSGFPIGLSDHPKIKDESIKEALHNRDLRRYLPYQKKNVGIGIGNIKSRGVVGTPSLTKRSH